MAPRMERVLAVDPGERTGWARALINTETGELTEISQGVSPLKDFALALHKRIDTYDTLVYEVWRLYPHKAKKLVGNDMQPSQLVGMIRLCAWLHPKVKLVSQGARIKKVADATMPDELKQRMSLSSEEHDQDALRHLWHYAWSKYGKQA